MFRFVALIALAACVSCDVVQYGGGAVVAPSIRTEQSNIHRSFGNLGQVATFSKTIDTPFSSVHKSDVRVSNPGYATYAHAAPVAYPHSYAAPAAYHHGAYAAPAYHHGAYAAPAYHAPAAYAHGPVVAKAAVAGGLLGVAYSPATVVSHMTYSNPIVSYNW